MIPPTAALAWCVLQVTLFCLVSAALYLVAKKIAVGVGAKMLAGSLALVLALTLLAISPWPRWQWSLPSTTTEAPARAAGSTDNPVSQVAAEVPAATAAS